MASPINKITLHHLAKLARIELREEEEERLLRDLQKILEYFEELKALDTHTAEPMTGSTLLKNIFRGDGESGIDATNQGNGKDAFPESYDGFLKVPAVK